MRFFVLKKSLFAEVRRKLFEYDGGMLACVSDSTYLYQLN